jgi:signal transduction histidine kinase/response regulator RpfG family c-di-GMP phosphodiesterase
VFDAGTDKLFTGEAGEVSYFFLILMVSIVSVTWAVSKRRSMEPSRLRGICGAFALLVISRLMFISSPLAGHSWIHVLLLSVGLTGFYLLFTSLTVSKECNGFAPVYRDVLLFGAIVGGVFGGILYIGVISRMTADASFPFALSVVSFVPAGFLFGSIREAKLQGMKNGFLPGIAGLFLVTAACLTGLSTLGLTGADPFWQQLLFLFDITGFFLLLAAVAIEGGGIGSGMFGWSGQEGAHLGAMDYGPATISADRAEDIGRMIADNESVMNIYREITQTAVDKSGAEFAMLRAGWPEDDLFKLEAYSGMKELDSDEVLRYSLTTEMILDICSEDRAICGGYMIGEADAQMRDSRLAPPDAEWQSRKVAFYPIREGDTVYGVLSLGFFDDPAQFVFDVMGLWASQVLQVIRREQMREKLRERERALSVCREELDSVNQLKSNFLSIVSHELRTPLTSVKAYTETLLENISGIERDTIRDFLKVMDEESQRLIKLVDNILNFSYMETGNLKVEKTSCNLNALVEKVYRSLQQKFLGSTVNCDLRLPRMDVFIDADGELIEQMLMHLMSNAVKFTPQGGRVTVTLEEEASAARIIVQDTGVGIPEDQLEKIFERFHQVDASNTREHGGSGLGLAICKNIVDWHDGKIWVENVKEAGAKFIVLLPMKDIVVRQAVASGFIGSIRFERERYLTLLVEMVSEFLQARKASVMLLDKDQLLLRIVAAKGLDPEFVQNTRLEVGERIAGKVVETGKSLHVFDIEKDSSVGRANNSMYYGSRSFVSVPLYDQGEVIGAVNVSDHIEGREFTKADREILESLALVIVGMLNKLDAYEKVSSNFEKLKDAMRSILDIREAWGSRNMSNLTLLVLSIGKRLDLDERSLTALRLGMNLYDLGMMKVPRNIRGKKEELSENEWEKLHRHPNIGYTLISPMGLEERIMKMIKSHHENFDGTGYPDGLKGAEIPVEARIINVVDTFRALISEGPYRRCFSIDEARNEIIKGAGTKFDPKVVGAFVKSLHDLGAREDKCELVLDAVERELEEIRRNTRRKGEKQRKEPVKEATP